MTFKVVTKYTGRKINKEDFVLPPYNPFITTNSLDKGAFNKYAADREVE
ncbi:MAG: hypothetical protein ACLU4N_03785 [Butyricimonas faecihominis]